ncbi:hypothetical protein [Enterococcus sp. BWR-S5]|uniref:hypothetical protein n=1 Tax=Enterococcus sp. BWR-S5 TaxID=2787714 RepID=UPI001921D3F8|nr:hypothetical protein [Enterococcus sp. BWR-S5]MBL1227120.1 hypothetical protein [Enterococcus sp. BWR-S5]
MKKYECENCGEKFKKEELCSDSFKEGTYYCRSCSDELMDAGWNAVDPDHNFDSFSDWDEHGH